MPSQSKSRSPRWYTIPVRVLLLTFIGTLIAFAVSLFVGIFGVMIVSAMHGIHPQMTNAYRHIALPVAGISGCVIFVATSLTEIRHYRQTKMLAAIERAS
jgi:hypothetical protein